MKKEIIQSTLDTARKYGLRDLTAETTTYGSVLFRTPGGSTCEVGGIRGNKDKPVGIAAALTVLEKL